LSGRFFSADFGQARLLRTIGAELLVVALFWPWLAARGWSFRAIAGTPEPVDLWRGILLALLAYVVVYVSAVGWVVFAPGTAGLLRGFRPVGSPAAWVVALTAVVNPIVEEFLWLGYGFTALQRYGVRIAVVGTIALRVSMHLYQGWMAFFGVLPIAVVFTVYFAQKKRIWPVIVAHILVDSIALVRLINK
jgi:hypothetical protein